MNSHTNLSFVQKINFIKNVKTDYQSTLSALSKWNINRYTLSISGALLGLMVSTNATALSATTSNVIQGSAPYLSLDNGVTKIMSEDGLLSIKLPDGSLYIAPGENSELYPNAKVDNSSYTNPIALPSEVKTFADIQTFVPLTDNTHYPSIELSNLIGEPHNYWGDADGDGNASATGKLKVKWLDADDKDITAEIKANPNRLLNGCDVPYQLTMTATNGTLSTEYGLPQTSTFNEISHTYYLGNKADIPTSCYALPNTRYDSQRAASDGPDWVVNAGFKIHSADKLTENFPTTGTNGIHFFLLLTGITPEQVVAANGTTVHAESGHGVTLSLSAAEVNWNYSYTWEDQERWDARPINPKTGVKIKLNGPTRDSRDKRFSPSVFKIYADSNHTHLLYSFKIERWYINNPPSSDEYGQPVYENMTFEKATMFCQELASGYRITRANDLTNANFEGWDGGVMGTESYGYQRRVSFKRGGRWIGGLFSEWGRMASFFKGQGNYDDEEDWGSEESALQNSDYAITWGDDLYWTNSLLNNNYLLVSPIDGSLTDGRWGENTVLAACVSP
ncbi:hypothetical protein A9G28_10155 [Gilliamella sp. Fer1-1]|uniref:hypothetical protein n=1 Tax=Gilliamella sp. Fer1-1 TaxID=3120240 RepID=UPI00080E31DF|nr:hypothetical protein [Gilliamella apicola]OCG39102.1 hypothetical protein A9G28_10155 [Gilliamella apicola]